MNRLGALVVMVSSALAAAQVWEEVDGGFRTGHWPTFFRVAEVFAPRDPTQPIVLRDSDDATTELRLRVISSDDAGVGDVLDGGASRVSWGSRWLETNGPTGITSRGATRFEVTWDDSLTPTVVRNGLGSWLFFSRGSQPVWSLQLQLHPSQPLDVTDAGVAWECGDCGVTFEVQNLSYLPRREIPNFGNETTVNAGGRVVSVEADGGFWEWTANPLAWKRLAESPGARFRPALAWDTQRSRLLLFGGQRGSQFLDDTWEWDGTAWTQVSTTTQPSPRMAHKMVFDPLRGRTVLFGGEGSSGVLGDTWEWNGTSWAQMTTPVAPSARDAMGLAWDGNRNEVLLFGGYGPTSRDDTWSWNGTRWVQLMPTTVPGPRSSNTMTWDEARRRVVMVGTLNSAPPLAAEWDGTNWAPIGDIDVARAGLVHLEGSTYVFTSTGAFELIDGGWQGPLRPHTGQFKFGSEAEDGGSLLFTSDDEELEFDGTWWVKRGKLPFSKMLSVTRGGDGRLIALAEGPSGVTAWMRENGVWTERGAAPRGILGSDSTGSVHVFGQGFASRFTGTDWAGVPWPTNITVNSAAGRSEGGFWVKTSNAIGIVEGGMWKQVSNGTGIGPFPISLTEPLLVSPGAPPVLVTPSGPWRHVTMLEDGGARLDFIPARSDFQIQSIAAGRAPWGAQLVATPGAAVAYSPWRTVSSRCNADAQCVSGVCADGRCCDRACGTSSCEVCSVERGASQNGVCTSVAETVCAPSVQPDAGTGGEEMPMPEKPSGCGCTSGESLLALAALMVLRRSRAARRRA